MQKYTIYITEPDVMDVGLVEAAIGEVPHEIIVGSRDFSKGDCASCDTVIIRSQTCIDASVIQKMPNLRHVVRVGTGLDTIDLEFCKGAGIAVYNAPGANASAVAEYVVTMSLMGMRKVFLLNRQDIKDWNRFKFVGHDIASSTIGIVGFGHIGRAVYERFSGLGCRNFLLYDPFVTDVPANARLTNLDTVLSDATVISLHVPLQLETRYCVGKQNLHLLQEGAILLNAARGGIVDESAVLETLQTKQFLYIADTVEHEPQVNPALLDNPNVLITPHIASLTHEAERAMVCQAVANLLANRQTA